MKYACNIYVWRCNVIERSYNQVSWHRKLKYEENKQNLRPTPRASDYVTNEPQAHFAAWNKPKRFGGSIQFKQSHSLYPKPHSLLGWLCFGVEQEH